MRFDLTVPKAGLTAESLMPLGLRPASLIVINESSGRLRDKPLTDFELDLLMLLPDEDLCAISQHLWPYREGNDLPTEKRIFNAYLEAVQNGGWDGVKHDSIMSLIQEKLSARPLMSRNRFHDVDDVDDGD